MYYYVIAKVWDGEEQRITNYIAGNFPDKQNAEIFARAYEEHYSAETGIFDERAIMKLTEQIF